MRKIFLLLACLLASGPAFPQAQFLLTNNVQFVRVPTNAGGGLIFQGKSESLLEFYNAGTNNILFAFGTTLTTTNVFQGGTTNAAYVAVVLTPGSTKTFNAHTWSGNMNIAGQTTNGGFGWLIINRGY